MSTRAHILHARTLRSAPTPPEALLWRFLQTLRHEGHHFRRQAPFLCYTLDFVCYRDRLVIEVDGAHHGTETQFAHDTIRDTILSRQNFRILRFPAPEIFQNLEGVSIAIRQTLIAPPNTPYPGKQLTPPTP